MDGQTRVEPGSYLTLHYSIATISGDPFASTFGLGPATLQLGSGQLAPSLEICLIGLRAGEHREFLLQPREAFGERNPQLIERIARAAFPSEVELKPDSIVEFTTSSGAVFSGFLRELNEQTGLFDFNHPLAGQPIRFEVEIVGIL